MVLVTMVLLRTLPPVDMCARMCADMCIDTSCRHVVQTWFWSHSSFLAPYAHIYMCVDIRADMSIDTCVHVTLVVVVLPDAHTYTCAQPYVQA